MAVRSTAPAQQPAQAAGSSAQRLLLVVVLPLCVGLVLVVYGGAGIYYLVQDRDVAQCKPSKRGAHVVWATDLFIYITASVSMAILAALWLFWHAALKRPLGLIFEDNEPLDWRLLWDGFCLSLLASLIAIFAYWGHSELWGGRNWCQDKSTIWEEIALHQFGRWTFWAQLSISALLYTAGWAFWLSPFVLEVKAALRGDVAPEPPKKVKRTKASAQAVHGP